MTQIIPTLQEVLMEVSSLVFTFHNAMKAPQIPKKGRGKSEKLMVMSKGNEWQKRFLIAMTTIISFRSPWKQQK